MPTSKSGCEDGHVVIEFPAEGVVVVVIPVDEVVVTVVGGGDEEGIRIFSSFLTMSPLQHSNN